MMCLSQKITPKPMPQIPRASVRLPMRKGVGGSVPAGAAIWLLHLGTWAVVGVIEHNWGIPAMVLLLTAAALLFCRFLTASRSLYTLMGIALLLRTALAIFAWYQGKGTDMVYWTGLNEDSNRFFLNSYLPASEAIWTTEDKGFPFINSIITRAASPWGQDHYLLNLQIVLFCGALFALATFAWAREISDEKSARAAAWIIALHPIVIGWSSGLMRDTIVAGFGWLMVYAILRCYSLRRRGLFGMLLLLIISGVITWFVRNMTFTYLLAVAFCLVLLRFERKSRILSKFLMSGAAVVALIVMVLSTNVFTRLSQSWAYGERFRSNVGVDDTTVNDGGISARMAQSGSWAVYVAAAPYAFIAPFPVYAKPSGFNGEPARIVDSVFNAGGFANLVLFVLLLPGLYLWKRDRRWDMLLLCGPVFWGICALCIMGAGQSRWVMPFLYPIAALTAARVVMHMEGKANSLFRLIFSALLSVLGVYLLYWLVKAELALTLCAFLAIPVLLMGGYGLLSTAARPAGMRGVISR